MSCETNTGDRDGRMGFAGLLSCVDPDSGKWREQQGTP